MEFFGNSKNPLYKSEKICYNLIIDCVKSAKYENSAGCAKL